MHNPFDHHSVNDYYQVPSSSDYPYTSCICAERERERGGGGERERERERGECV